MKRRVAVLFGGRSPEHDVSVITGLQGLKAVDQQKFDAFPVYLSPQGIWLTGEPLRERANYLPGPELRRKLTEVHLDLTPGMEGQLLPRDSGLFSRPKPIPFDLALPAFHGLFGEDGPMQGLFEMANIPYAGMRVLASSVLMDKGATKRILAGCDIPLLPYALIDRPASGLLMKVTELSPILEAAGIGFPCCVKPVHLGSSIGVARVGSLEALQEVLPGILKLDSQAIVEPFVPNLVEYNVAVGRFDGTLRSSAIERPKRQEELLDFRQKYMSGSGKGSKGGSKQPGQASEGMLSLTRDINPDLPAEAEANLRRWAEAAFTAVGGSGAPRIDFLCNQETGEMWLNEVNPCPGSFGYFLWEAAPQPLFFTELLTHLLEEAQALNRRAQLPEDPTPTEARLLKRP